MSPPARRAFAPATVSNVACGFDVLGFAVAGPGDLVSAEERPEPGIVIAELSGDGGRLPREAERNTAGVATRALLERAGLAGRGVLLRIEKQMPLASGLGSSAASAVAAVVAVDALFGLGLAKPELLACALEGEKMACGSAHADNAAPSLYGGFVLVRGSESAGDPLEVVELPLVPGLTCALVRPHVEVETRGARRVLGDSVPLGAVVRQCGNLAALVAALFRQDFGLLSRSLEDHIAEPKRAEPGSRLPRGAGGGPRSGRPRLQPLRLGPFDLRAVRLARVRREGGGRHVGGGGRARHPGRPLGLARRHPRRPPALGGAQQEKAPASRGLSHFDPWPCGRWIRSGNRPRTDRSAAG